MLNRLIFLRKIRRLEMDFRLKKLRDVAGYFDFSYEYPLQLSQRSLIKIIVN